MEGRLATLALYSLIGECYKRWSSQHVVKWAHRSYLELRILRNATPLHFCRCRYGVNSCCAYVDWVVCQHSSDSMKDHIPGVRLVRGCSNSMLMILQCICFSYQIPYFHPAPWHPLHLSALFLSSVFIFAILLLRLCIAGDLSNGIFIKLPPHSTLGQMLKVGKVVREPVYSELCEIHCRSFETFTSCFNPRSWHSWSMSARIESEVCGIIQFLCFSFSAPQYPLSLVSP